MSSRKTILPRRSKSNLKVVRTRARRSGLAPKLESKEVKVDSDVHIQACRAVVAASKLVEHKTPVPAFRGLDAPQNLAPPSSSCRIVATPEATILANQLRLVWGDRHYRFRISNVLSLPSTGSGVINATISNASIGSNSDFTSLLNVFTEFFIVGFRVDYQPVSRYQYPVTGTSTLSASSLPMGLASIHHGNPAYSSISSMSQNYAYKHTNTSDPFTYSWINLEKPSTPTNTQPVSTGGLVQGWANVTDAASYTGFVQFLTAAAPPALPVTQTIGEIATHYDVLFRTRQ